MGAPEYPTFRDLYETAEKADQKLEKVETRVGRVEKAVIVLVVVTASPKLGGPSASQLITALLNAV